MWGVSACGPPSFAHGGKGCKTPPRTKVLGISFLLREKSAQCSPYAAFRFAKRRALRTWVPCFGRFLCSSATGAFYTKQFSSRCSAVRQQGEIRQVGVRRRSVNTAFKCSTTGGWGNPPAGFCLLLGRAKSRPRRSAEQSPFQKKNNQKAEIPPAK